MASKYTWPFPPELVPNCICSKRFIDRHAGGHRKKCRYGLHLKARKSCDQRGCWGRVACRVCGCPAKAHAGGLFTIGRELEYADVYYGSGGQVHRGRVCAVVGYDAYCLPEFTRTDTAPSRTRRRRWYWRDNPQPFQKGTWAPHAPDTSKLLAQSTYYAACEIPNIPVFVFDRIRKSADGNRVKHQNRWQSYSVSTRVSKIHPPTAERPWQQYEWENCIVPHKLPPEVVQALPERYRQAYEQIHEYAKSRELTT